MVEWLAAMLAWVGDSRQRLNQDKAEVLHLGASGVCGLGASLPFGELILSDKDELCILGIILHPVQIAAVVCSTYFHLRQMLHPHQDSQSLTVLVHVLVSILDYSNDLYVGLPMKLIQKIQ